MPRSVNALVHPSAVVHGEIGEGTTVGPLVYIGPKVTIGSDCIISPGAIIGSDGFGYEKQDDGSWKPKPQGAGGVVIADDIHIGANSVIHAGSYRPTSIGSGTRIDASVFVAHNVQIGRDCLIIAQSEISGSVEIGDRVYIAPAVSVRDHISIGAGAFVGLGSVVVADVEPGTTIYGVPAKVRH
jgi:UDP-3-O-[3-hydroxymyristoyl] glucosamine N-acyltransferase